MPELRYTDVAALLEERGFALGRRRCGRWPGARPYWPILWTDASGRNWQTGARSLDEALEFTAWMEGRQHAPAK